MSLSLCIQSSGQVIAHRVSDADSFWSRSVGLLGRRAFLAGEALILRGTRQVHMFFMKFPIDAIFCNLDGTIIHIESALQPWRVSPFIRHASYVVEVPSGTAATHALKPGDRLVLSAEG